MDDGHFQGFQHRSLRRSQCSWFSIVAKEGGLNWTGFDSTTSPVGEQYEVDFFLRHLPLRSVVNRQVKTAHRKKEILVTLRLVERFQQTKLSDCSFVQIFGSFSQQQAGFKGKEAISKSSPSLSVYRVNMITYERNLFLRHLERRVYIRM